jgi:transcriptional regulator with XRE-family HTH domain
MSIVYLCDLFKKGETMSYQDEFSEKFDLFVKSENLTNEKTGKSLGIAESTVRKYRKGEAQPKAGLLKLMYEKLTISPLWYLLGKGPAKLSKIQEQFLDRVLNLFIKIEENDDVRTRFRLLESGNTWLELEVLFDSFKATINRIFFREKNLRRFLEDEVERFIFEQEFHQIRILRTDRLFLEYEIENLNNIQSLSYLNDRKAELSDCQENIQMLEKNIYELLSANLDAINSFLMDEIGDEDSDVMKQWKSYYKSSKHL